MHTRSIIGSLAMCLLLSVVNVAFAQTTSRGVAGMQGVAAQSAGNSARTSVLEAKVEELSKLQSSNAKKNSARIAALRREIDQAKRDNCYKAPDYRLCLDKQDELERLQLAAFQQLMQGCYDEPGQVTADGVTVGGKKTCAPGMGILTNPAAIKGSLNLTTVRTPNGSVVTSQTWNAPNSNITQADLNRNWGPVGRVLAVVGACAVGAAGGGYLAYKIADEFDPNTDVIRDGKLVEVRHGSAHAWKWVGGTVTCLAAGTAVAIATD